MDIKSALQQIAAGQSLSQAEMTSVMRTVMTGDATAAQIGALLMGLRMKGESVDEITGAASVMRELATHVHIDQTHLVDTCGTGGDGANLFNVSTASAFVAAASGVRVAKHGNRSVSSSTGSADVLEAAGVNLALNAEQVKKCIDTLGVGFMFAPSHHSAMKHAIGPRRDMGMRTIFNMLGPMTNPALVKRQVIGVFNRDLCRPMAEVLGRLGSEHVLVVHAEDGLDEITLSGHTFVAELNNGEIREYRITPADFNIETQTLEGLSVATAAESLALIRNALGKQDTAAAKKAADIIALNAGAAIYVSGVADSIAQGVAMAQDAIGSGLAREKIQELAAFTECFRAN
ncbi:anthranilate phosphoribosyltransferase [Simiduia sp. 21SJ11W-1]|uniref:anthranilate phosphoribosyltransferase n=1 Tax=Simiduia sp. 21SJ11W-1 TaxID=2909669 RepID=UPI0020A1A1E7|nr:anthranilate phosphoribosyltransferase [Simiduia sp. 21SJ11W-1]UTA48593.1 anthranilate phosphoribosyltransferase [Simiduia sp. 21SJ11W-1]